MRLSRITDTPLEDTSPPDEDSRGSLLSIFADFGLTLGSIRDEVKRANQIALVQARLARQPNPITWSRAVALGTGGVGVVDFGTPQDGRIWTIRQLMASGQGVEQFTAGVVEANTSAFAAGAAGSVGLPSGPPNGVTQYITGFVVTIGNASAGTPQSTVTLNNVSGGPIVYTIEQSNTSGTTFTQNFPAPGLQVTGTPSLTISATTNGGAGNLTLYGTASTTPGLVNWYVGPLMSANNTPLWRWQTKSMPGLDKFTSNLIQVRAQEHLYALITGGIVNQTIVCNAIFLDEPFKSQTAVVES